VIVVDTSVAVAAALTWHKAHEAVRSELPSARTRLIAHVAIETYSVLTRLPPPQRVAAPVARAFLADSFESPLIVLSPGGYERLLDLAAGELLVRGGVYDAVVAAAATEAGATLLTLDRRAAATYRLLETDYRMLD
jgi:predicted nucleic acid-binding protein